MRVPSYLSRSRHGIYYFRLHVPEHLRESVGNRTNIRQSLRTGNAQEAIRLARGLVAQYHTVFTSNAPLGMAIKPNPNDTHLIAEIDLSKGIFKLDYDHNNPTEVSNAERILNIFEARHNAPASHQNALVAPTPHQAPQKASGVTFPQAIAAFIESATEVKPGQRTAKKGWNTASSAGERKSNLQEWAYHIGEMDVAHVTHDMIIEARTNIALTPPNFKKRLTTDFKGQTLETVLAKQRTKWQAYITDLEKARKNDMEVINVAIEDYLETRSNKTVNNYLWVLRQFYEYAIQQKWVATNEANGLDLPEDDSKGRDPFSADELKAIFESRYYKLEEYNRPEQYFVPHIQLFTGARLNEVCQLQTADIVFPENIPGSEHIPCFYFHEGVGQKLKNKESVRLIPIHPKLWNDLGFKEYYETIKSHGFAYLFPNLRLDGKEKRSDYVGDWFGRLLDILKIKRPEISNHSFRHTFINFFKQNQLPERIAADIAGHAYSRLDKEKLEDDREGRGKTYQMYGDNYYPHVLMPYIEQVDFKLELTPFKMLSQNLVQPDRIPKGIKLIRNEIITAEDNQLPEMGMNF